MVETEHFAAIDIDNPIITYDHYRLFKIPKKKLINGIETVTGLRVIHEPCPELKQIQKEILNELSRTKGVKSSNVSHAFTNYKSIKTMALPHIKAKYLVRIDIKDFFPSITPMMMQREMLNAGYPTKLIKKVLLFCFLDNSLPQGAPTSPFLSNIVGRAIDCRMLGLAKKWRSAEKLATKSVRSANTLRLEPIAYSRYADDLVFSSDYYLLKQIKYPVNTILTSLGFRINPKKTLTSAQPKRLVVCGITINSKLSKPKDYRKNLQAQLHNMIMQKINGKIQANEYIGPNNKVAKINFEQLAGKISHITDVCAEQGNKLKQLFDIVKEVHTCKPPWSLQTKTYLLKRKNVLYV